MALPSPTVLAEGFGYIPTGVRRYSYVPTIADKDNPTSAELTAGTDLTNLIADVSGFSGTGATVDRPNAGSTWTAKVAGMISADDSSFTLNMNLSGADDALDMFSDGSDGSQRTSGYFVIYYEGIVTDGRLKVFPIMVTSVAPSTGVGDIATAVVNVAITQPPSAFTTVPTA